MIRTLGTLFAALAGLVFGSFLNVCVTRWPQGESIVTPRSHCRSCGRTLTWWENLPLLSWLALRGRCRTCSAWIGCRYPLVELAVGALWASVAWRFIGIAFSGGAFKIEISVADALSKATFYWLLVALATLDAEHLWLPDRLTITGAALGFLATTFLAPLDDLWWFERLTAKEAAIDDLLAIALAALLILLIRWLYKLLRHREGVGLGDAKLMAMLAAWLGFEGALLSFAIGVVLGSIVALIALALPSRFTDQQAWPLRKMPLGTFLCIGGILSALWGQSLIAAYLRWAGL